jgi:hypothetical protein
MKVNEKILQIIQDHELVTQYIEQLCYSIGNPDIGLPNFVPVCHDAVLTDMLTKIIEHIRDLRWKNPC